MRPRVARENRGYRFSQLIILGLRSHWSEHTLEIIAITQQQWQGPYLGNSGGNEGDVVNIIIMIKDFAITAPQNQIPSVVWQIKHTQKRDHILVKVVGTREMLYLTHLLWLSQRLSIGSCPSNFRSRAWLLDGRASTTTELVIGSVLAVRVWQVFWRGQSGKPIRGLSGTRCGRGLDDRGLSSTTVLPLGPVEREVIELLLKILIL